MDCEISLANIISVPKISKHGIAAPVFETLIKGHKYINIVKSNPNYNSKHLVVT